ncbi:MAG: hypothetical protein FWE62_02505 [Firmicutes bacterium]|nr:hypothetical protein [Bacillota bacterium]
MKKLFTVLLAAAMAFAGLSLTACGPKTDKTKSQLSIYNYDGGVGTQWLYDAAKKFEEKYADKEFEPGSGKKGVQIHVGKGKETQSLGLATSTYNILFLEDVAYNDLISQNLLLDINDIVAEKTLAGVTDGADKDKKIAEKILPEVSAALTALKGRHFVLPHYSYSAGLTYDATIFAREELYIKADTDGGALRTGSAGNWTYQFTGNVAEATVGPNGEAGDYDDGLPATYEEFDALLDRMIQRGVVPFIWSGQYPGYTNILTGAAWAAYSGKEEMMLNFNFGSGAGAGKSMNIITGFTGTGYNAAPTVVSQPITPANAYYTYQQEGKYYALRMLKKVLSDSTWYSDKITGALSHLGAQTEYIYSDLENKPIAMIIEGNYWYNEAEDAFKRSQAKYPEAPKDRDFRWMSLPVQADGRVSKGNGKKNTLLDLPSSFAFINGNVKDKPWLADLAKTFLQFCYSDELLADFTCSTGLLKGVEYEVPGERVQNMNKFYQSYYEVRKNSDNVYPYSNHPIYVNGQSSFLVRLFYWKSEVNGTPYQQPYTPFRGSVSAADYFQGMWMSGSDWTGDYGAWIGA